MLIVERLADRSSRPHRSPTRLAEHEEKEIEALRRQRLTGPAIVRRLGRPTSIVGVVLRRRGLSRLCALDPRPPNIRYQRERPGELLHIDIKEFGRIDGIGHRLTHHVLILEMNDDSYRAKQSKRRQRSARALGQTENPQGNSPGQTTAPQGSHRAIICGAFLLRPADAFLLRR
jgi:hypothetical protein